MSKRPKHWIKLWVSWLTTPAHFDLSEGAFGLGPLLLLLATWDGTHEGGGWLLTEDGAPMSESTMARATHRTVARLRSQIDELVKCKTLSVREDGARGFANFGHWQETKDAKRMRVGRANKPANSSEEGSPLVQPRRLTADADADADADSSLRSSTPTPPPEGPASTPPFALDAKPTKPGKAKKPKPQPDERIEQVLAAIDAERERAGLPPLTASQRTATTIAGAFGRGATLERVLAVVGAFGDEVAKGAVGRDVLNATTMFTGPSSSRGGGFAWGESLVDRGLGGAPANNNRRGPAAPSPRPEVSGEVDLGEIGGAT
jgi:hypothetical protein